ncbi:hypothetical protein [Pedobacter sp. GR22-6]|uniref:hypothetical protein n=1 Tax=Pedobacter sp. GR22-6 TaxID=3127957 RepID=UPI00307DF074
MIVLHLLLYNLKEAACEKDADALKMAMKVYQAFIWDTDQEFEPWHTAWVYVHIMGTLDALIQLNTSSFFDFEYGQTFGNFYGAYIYKYADRYPKPPDADTTVNLLYELFQKVEACYINL